MSNYNNIWSSNCWAMLAVVVLFSSCSGERDAPASDSKPQEKVAQPLPKPNASLTTQAHREFEHAEAAATALNLATTDLLAQPDIESLARAQEAWQQAAVAVEALHVFSRLGALPQSDHRLLITQQYQIAAWPIEPGYLDAYGEHLFSGLVFDVGLPLSTAVLREQHGLTSSSDATLGIYAIEFLLFGENSKRGALAFQPLTGLNEQHLAEGYQQITELPRNRRRQLLQLQTHILAEDVQQLAQYWRTQNLMISDKEFRQATRAMLTEQIVAVANQQKPAAGFPVSERQKQNRLLAQRLAAQLGAWRRSLEHTTLVDPAELAATTEQALQALQQMTTATAETAPADPATAHGQWQQVYRHLRKLAALLADKNKPLEPVTEQAVPAEPLD